MAERFGTESPPEVRVAPRQTFLIVLEGLAGRTRSRQTGLRLGIVAHVTFAAFFLEDLLRDVIDRLEFPYAMGTRPHIRLRQAVRFGQCSLMDIASPRYEPAAEILEAVVRAAAVDNVRRAP